MALAGHGGGHAQTGSVQVIPSGQACSAQSMTHARSLPIARLMQDTVRPACSGAGHSSEGDAGDEQATAHTEYICAFMMQNPPGYVQPSSHGPYGSFSPDPTVPSSLESPLELVAGGSSLVPELVSSEATAPVVPPCVIALVTAGSVLLPVPLPLLVTAVDDDVPVEDPSVPGSPTHLPLSSPANSP